MSMVRFATKCDSCGKRSPEYDRWPVCSECGNDVCPDCYVPGTKTDADEDTPETALCLECDDLDHEQAELVEDEEGWDRS